MPRTMRREAEEVSRCLYEGYSITLTDATFYRTFLLLGNLPIKAEQGYPTR